MLDDDALLEDEEQEEPEAPLHPQRFIITRGDATLLPMRQGALVNPSNTGLILNSGVSASILRRGGPFIQQSLHQLRSGLKGNRLPPGRALETDPGQLPYKYLIHVAIAGARKINERLITRALLNLFDKLDELELGEVIIPPLGYGTGKFSLEEFLTLFWEVAVDEIPRAEHLRDVYLCLENDDEFQKAVAHIQEHLDAAPDNLEVVVDERGIGLGLGGPI